MKKHLFLLIFLITFYTARAQDHTHHDQVPRDSTTIITDSSGKGHKGHLLGDHVTMNHAFSRNLPMSRNGSGTSWLPDATPMYMYMARTGNTNFMFHGSLFLRYNKQDVFEKGKRGTAQVDLPNWFMMMMNTKIGERGLLNVNAMFSLDPFTVGKSGYPLLFQTGETYNGERLVDRQHPHDLFNELSVGYTYMINKSVDVIAYIGYPGEPALGPTAFMHRISSMSNPDAPLGHHWQDATHITFGVATAGVRYKNWKGEFSSFTGREPDENRYGFDKARFDSYSFRLSYNPAPGWALQASHGFIKSPEILEPTQDVRRSTVSALYSKEIPGNNKYLTGAIVWGFNDKGDNHTEHSFLIESNWQLNNNTLYQRYEYIQRSPEELDLDHVLFDKPYYDIHALTVGYSRRILSIKHIDVMEGLQTTVYFPQSQLQPEYGKVPVAFQIYLQFRPSLHRMK